MFHIVFNADENYIKYLAVLLTSIIKSTQIHKSFNTFCEANGFEGSDTCEAYTNLKEQKNEEGYVFHILNNHLNPDTKEKLENLQKELCSFYPCKILIHHIDESEFANFPLCGAAGKNFLPYYRLKAFEFINKTDKFLYLDSDMLVKTDLRELFAIDLKDKVLACVGDCGSKKRKIKFKTSNKTKTLNFDESYFNSGFLLINLKEFKKGQYYQKIKKLALSCTYIKAADQDLLNACIPKDKILKLSYAWNFQTITFAYAICKDEAKNRLDYTRKEFTQSMKTPKILHYGEKPWLYLQSFLDLQNKNINDFWWEVAAKTPCFSTELLEQKKHIKHYLLIAKQGELALKACESFLVLLELKNLIKKEPKSTELSGMFSFELCLLVGEMITFARRENKSALSVFLKILKVKRLFFKYYKNSRL